MSPSDSSSSLKAPGAVPGATVSAWEWLVRGVLVLGAPLLTLILVESVLRLADVGFEPGFWIEVPDRSGVLVSNPAVGKRFFPPAAARRPVPTEVEVPKPDDVYRVVVLGGSAAMGIPDPAFAFGRMVEIELQKLMPERRVEVINGAMTAINSHVVRALAEDMPRVDPDAVLIYMGNNEVVGPWGAGTVLKSRTAGLALVRASIALGRLRIGQVLGSFVGASRAPRAATESTEIETADETADETVTGWRGMALFSRFRIGPDDPALKRVYAHFERNLTDTIEHLQRADIEVLVSTVGVDLRGTPPFASLHDESWKGRDAVTKVLRRRDFGAALSLLDAAEEEDPDHAEVAFLRGTVLAQLGRPEEARDGLVKARDGDALRFRADSKINRIIRQVAQRTGAVLVDGEARLAAASPDGLPGEELFWEHVHLKPLGNQVLADGFVARLTDREAESRHDFDGDELDGDAVAWSTVQHHRVASQIVAMMDGEPFVRQWQHERRSAQRHHELRRLLHSASQPEALAEDRRRLEAALEARPDDVLLLQATARRHAADGRLEEAIDIRRRLARRFAVWPDLWVDLGNELVAHGNYDGADIAYGRAAVLDPQWPDVPFNRGVLEIRRGRLSDALAWFDAALGLDPGHMPSHLNRATALERLGRADEALVALEQAVRADPAHAEARVELGTRLAAAGRLGDAEAQYRAAVVHRPHHAPAWYNLGVATARAGRDDEALQAYGAALRADPELVQARDNLVEILTRRGALAAESGDAAAALVAFRQAVAAHPDHAPAHFNLAKALHLAGREDEARLALRDALDVAREFGPPQLVTLLEAETEAAPRP